MPSKSGIKKVEIWTPNTFMSVLNGQQIQDADLNTFRHGQNANST